MHLPRHVQLFHIQAAHAEWNKRQEHANNRTEAVLDALGDLF